MEEIEAHWYESNECIRIIWYDLVGGNAGDLNARMENEMLEETFGSYEIIIRSESGERFGYVS